MVEDGTQPHPSWMHVFGAIALLPLGGMMLRNRERSLSITIAFSFLALCSTVWFTLVSQTVPQPYLDEVFHIPQAQRYCQGRYLEWDDKITTPPGLYLVSLALLSISRTARMPWLFGNCDTSLLRMTNVLGLSTLACLALLCRHQIEARLCTTSRRAALSGGSSISTHAVHTALNVALFPVLFFFSGLYYTDVLSTVAVLGAYLNHLKRVERDKSSFLNDIFTILLGLVALLMRQTNVFWIVVWMGGLEAVHAIHRLRPERVDQCSTTSMSGRVKIWACQCSQGRIHDVPLNQAWPDDMLLTILSLGIAAACNPFRVLRQIWPHVCVLALFSGFVVWNGGVVLGDKANHIATIHLAQMLYIWPLFGFFSLPLLIPYGLTPVAYIANALGVIPHRTPASKPSKPSTPTNSQGTARRNDRHSTTTRLSPTTRTTPHIKHALWAMYLLITVVISAVIVKYNTIIHPFTLADNRHYMFYIFRHTVRRGNLARMLLIVPYTVARWMTWGALAGTMHSSLSSGRQHPTQNDTPAVVSTSTALLLLLTTSLSLVTAPLVEPRYFIIPWVMWRLSIPAWHPGDHPTVNDLFRRAPTDSLLRRIMGLCDVHDLRLHLETVWFMAINAVTGFIFLKMPYVWKDESGRLLDDGRLQRFMW